VQTRTNVQFHFSVSNLSVNAVSDFAIPYCPIQSDEIAGNGSDRLQVKNLRYSPADARRRGTLRLRACLSH